MSHGNDHGHSSESRSIISFKNSFWLVVIIVGLFIAALNFIKAESGGEGEGNSETTEKTEMKAAEPANTGTTEAKTETAPAAEAKDTANKSTK